MLCSVGTEANRWVEGLSLGEVARRRGTSVVDTLLDVLLEERLDVSFVAHNGRDEDVQRIISAGYHVVGSDCLHRGTMPHPRTYGTFPRCLAWALRGAIDLPTEAMVAKMTSAPARVMGLGGRGLLAEGMAADLVVLDPATLADTATFDAPRRAPEGVRHVLVNGLAVVRDGRLTGATPGLGLRRKEPAAAGTARTKPPGKESVR